MSDFEPKGISKEAIEALKLTWISVIHELCPVCEVGTAFSQLSPHEREQTLCPFATVNFLTADNESSNDFGIVRVSSLAKNRAGRVVVQGSKPAPCTLAYLRVDRKNTEKLYGDMATLMSVTDGKTVKVLVLLIARCKCRLRANLSKCLEIPRGLPVEEFSSSDSMYSEPEDYGQLNDERAARQYGEALTALESKKKNKKLDLLRSGVGMADDDDSSDPFAPTSSKSAIRKAKPPESSTVVPTSNTPRPQAPKPPKPRALETTDVFKKPTGMGSSRKTVKPKTAVLPTPKAAQSPVLEMPESALEGTPDETAAAERSEGETDFADLLNANENLDEEENQLSTADIVLVEDINGPSYKSSQAWSEALDSITQLAGNLSIEEKDIKRHETSVVRSSVKIQDALKDKRTNDARTEFEKLGEAVKSIATTASAVIAGLKDDREKTQIAFLTSQHALVEVRQNMAIVHALTAPGASSFMRDRKDAHQSTEFNDLVQDARLFLQDALGAREEERIRGIEKKVLDVCAEKQPRVVDSRVPLLWMPVYHVAAQKWKGMSHHKGIFENVEEEDGEDLTPYYTIRQDKKGRDMLLVSHGVWLRRQLVRNMAREFSKVKRGETVKLDRERFRTLVVMYAEQEFTPLELANLHLDNMNPLTEVKMAVLRDLIKEFVEGSNAQGYGDVPRICTQALARHGNRIRYFHYHLGRNSQMIWSFGRRNAGDFMKYVVDTKNAGDGFYREFYMEENLISKTVLESMLQIKIRGNENPRTKAAVQKEKDLREMQATGLGHEPYGSGEMPKDLEEDEVEDSDVPMNNADSPRTARNKSTARNAEPGNDADAEPHRPESVLTKRIAGALQRPPQPEKKKRRGRPTKGSQAKTTKRQLMPDSSGGTNKRGPGQSKNTVEKSQQPRKSGRLSTKPKRTYGQESGDDSDTSIISFSQPKPKKAGPSSIAVLPFDHLNPPVNRSDVEEESDADDENAPSSSSDSESSNSASEGMEEEASDDDDDL